MKKKNKWVTIHQVAEHAGVSSMTVSRYLKDKNSIRAKNIAPIKQAIQALGYVPNRMAVGLSGGQLNVVGIILPTLSVSIFRHSLDCISHALGQNNIELIVAVTNYNDEREKEIIDNFLSWRVKGLVLTGLNQSPDVLKTIYRSGTACIHIADTDTPDGFMGTAVGFSHYKGGYEMGQYMVQKGYQRLAYLSTKMSFLDHRNNNRYQGFLEGAIALGGHVSTRMNIGSEVSYITGYEAVDNIDLNSYDGLMFASDELAVGATLGLMEKGISIPDDVAICGYHGSGIAQCLPKKLTSYSISWHSIGDLVLEQFKVMWDDDYDNTPKLNVIELDSHIIEGESC